MLNCNVGDQSPKIKRANNYNFKGSNEISEVR